MDKEPVSLTCAHHIIDSLPRLTRLLSKDLRLHSSGLFTSSQFRVMVRLFREGSQCLSVLADFMGVSLPTMSKLIQGLESRGLVLRERDSDDRRRVLLGLTDSGVRAYASLLERTESHIVDWIGDLSPQQCEQVIDALVLLDGAFGSVVLPTVYPKSELGLPVAVTSKS